MKNPSYTYNDRSQDAYYESIVFPSEQTIVTVPSDPLDEKETPLFDYGAKERRAQIELDAQARGFEIDWRHWKYFEVRPDPERLYIRTTTLRIERRLFLIKDYYWNDELTCHFDFTELDELARKYNQPTIREYYAKVQFDRLLKKQAEEATMRSLESWTREYPVTKLLEILHRDLKQHLDKFRACNWGWHYVMYAGSQKSYYSCANTEFLLKSLIAQAEDCLRKDVPVRFAYCLPEHMPAGIEYRIAPVQD